MIAFVDTITTWVRGRRPLVVVTLVAVSSVCHGASLYIFNRAPVAEGAMSGWSEQFLALWVASAAATVVVIVLYDRYSACGFFLLELLLALVIANPEGPRIGIRLLLLMNVAVVGTVALKPGFNILAGALAVLGGFCSPAASSLWGKPVSGIPPENRIMVAAALSVAAIVGTVFRFTIAANRLKREEISRLNLTIDRLASANEGFQTYTRFIEEKSMETERKRITSEVHDAVGYTLTNIIMMSREAGLLSRNDAFLSALLEKISRQAQDGLQEARFALRVLRAIDRSGPTLHEAVMKLVVFFRDATGVDISVNFGNMIENPSETVRDTLAGVIREGLTNSLRHGKASRIDVSFWIGDGWLSLDMLDNGVGADIIEEGIGLAGMRERIGTLDGTLQAGNVPGGFRLKVSLPAKVGRGDA
jgi:signal transduction histidine kinase